MSRQESPKIPHKHSRLSNEGRRGTPSMTKTPSDQWKSIQRRRLSIKYVNRSSWESAQTSAIDATFLDRLHIDTPTPENVWNTSGQENIFVNFLWFIYIYCWITKRGGESSNYNHLLTK